MRAMYTGTSCVEVGLRVQVNRRGGGRLILKGVEGETHLAQRVFSVFHSNFNSIRYLKVRVWVLLGSGFSDIHVL